MKLIQKLLPLALVSATGLVQAQVPQFTEVGFGTGTLDFAGYNAYWYQNFTVKINSRYSFTPELRTDFKFTEKKVQNFSVEHYYLRFVISDNNLATLGDWKLGMAYRYVAPTTLSAQESGTFGRIGFRPAFTLDKGAFGLLVRNEFQLHMQRNQYQLNPKGSANPAGNSLVGNVLEIAPDYDLGNNMDVGLLFVNANTMKGKAKLGETRTLASENTWVNQIQFVAEFGYTIAAADDLRIALSFSTDTYYGKNPEFGVKPEATENHPMTLFAKANSEFGITLQKAY